MDKSQKIKSSGPGQTVHRRLSSPSSGLLSKLPFGRASHDGGQTGDSVESQLLAASNVQGGSQQERKPRRRGGSLRKVALLSKSGQRERRDDVSHAADVLQPGSVLLDAALHDNEAAAAEHDALGLNIGNSTSSSTNDNATAVASSTGGITSTDQYIGSAATSYASTTDEEDVLQLPPADITRTVIPVFSAADSYFGNNRGVQRKRSFQQVKSPLSYSGMSTTAMPPPDTDWDYSETEWWGWIVLSVTWSVFVVGMGSCLDVWSWAWDVGKTPYAPPELEDDPTLPIVGYYPALIILTCIMAWVWVVVAWVGMKYFRHAKISGD